MGIVCHISIDTDIYFFVVHFAFQLADLCLCLLEPCLVLLDVFLVEDGSDRLLFELHLQIGELFLELAVVFLYL